MKECLLYVFSGFLESGKTTLIKETLSDPAFQSNEKNLIILCEEGEVAYEESFLNSVNANVIQDVYKRQILHRIFIV